MVTYGILHEEIIALNTCVNCNYNNDMRAYHYKSLTFSVYSFPANLTRFGSMSREVVYLGNVNCWRCFVGCCGSLLVFLLVSLAIHLETHAYTYRNV